MSQVPSNSLVNLGDLGKPANTLIEKISDAVGGVFLPYQVKRLAKADAEAALIKAQSDIAITDAHRRAVRRWVEEEAQRQTNMESIAAKAIPLLNYDANATSIENDWIVNFFDKSRIVSDGQMQGLWSRILAGEANVPGTYSKRTVNVLSDLDKVDAEMFTRLCSFSWVFQDNKTPVPLIFDVSARIYTEHGINFGVVTHLDTIGLVQFSNLTGFIRQGVPKTCSVRYYERGLLLNMKKEADNDLELGKVFLTRVGSELARVCESDPVDGLWDYVANEWKAYLPSHPTDG